MKIQVLGSGCPTCAKLHTIVEKAVSEMDIQAEVEYITGVEGTMKIAQLGAMTGFTPDIEKIKQSITVFKKKK